MKTFDQFSKRVLVICAGICMILITNAFLPNNAQAEKKSATINNTYGLVPMGVDNGYAYYIWIPSGAGQWEFSRIAVSKASDATWK